MTVQLPVEREFNLPEGYYRVGFVSARPYDGTNLKKMIRLIFEDLKTAEETRIYTAGKNFELDMGKGGKLRVFLESWLGSAFFHNRGRNFNFDDLVGRQADIVISHIHNKDRSEPFCHIAAIHPPGTLIPLPYAQEKGLAA